MQIRSYTSVSEGLDFGLALMNSLLNKMTYSNPKQK